ncbi:MAG: glycosyltransferase family 10 [Puniceicoccaceae bacterium]
MNDQPRYFCRVVSGQFNAESWPDIIKGSICYTPRVTLDRADALLVLYDPSEELLRFEGPKLWFTIEPSWHYHFKRHPIGKRLVKRLNLSERAWYGNPDPDYRVPHPTHRQLFDFTREKYSKKAAVACINNFGGRAWFLKRYIRLRNKFVFHPLVDLYGSPQAWANFRQFPFLWRKGPPINYKGRRSPGEDHYASAHLRLLSSYKVNVCLENSTEFLYFTEKFVNAAQAGCIPVYHAHESVRNTFLQGAKWVDPKDFNFSANKTIRYALRQDQEEYREVNDHWLKSNVQTRTDDRYVLDKLHAILESRLPPSKSKG